ncbi:UDP-N-acetylmuramoyl-L-alanyl-D-glutamate--2,6-diaminopimelate ligase [Bifidobacterium felsineum]|uniref:UDP-N-acetylmuramoyl-L-alanyl-D-glutamate--2, 6-diaminopimelate ligase n=1 Tax=Bifidobacterium felsineum TaxID=2045440 RepID=A0A2M9HJU2_9BIFI|nr:UDP-N-acetylmuramoyl-L-alanyl-D-glutamate--2,6-diaminopimelate ligase [Bifidobacterium felsineum]MBT1164138.1 UDP-N-acetylmuramoyl-L-alanyl-D-glutamate--2,6-diaminopimelate ligase [Bifidobacterium felsineum]PJM77057.1 UDP-N-acetylmuramoyl-L-alanyl-D-glutamate--2,6-diaminopimelate ligase [Bifidobacterium felsineum]
MALTLASAAQLLEHHHLLREIIAGDCWTLDAGRIAEHDHPFGNITYDTREVADGTLLFCKGNFKSSFLRNIDERGLAAYVAQTDYSQETSAPGLIVTDVRKAMSLLSAEFFGRPQDKLTVIGITGTKGKTTTAYFTQAVLNAYSDGKCALFSSVDNCLDGHTYVESALTTPESLDAFRMMHEAVSNGMRYLVMEVSSQAYKVNRVYGLTFDVAAFLNISPDHISPIEHPTFEDYLYCKRQITNNCKLLVLGTDCDHADLIREDAHNAQVPVVTFALRDGDTGSVAQDSDFIALPDPNNASRYIFREHGQAIGDFSLELEGGFNAANAATAIALSRAAGVPEDSSAFAALEHVRISGRMEHFANQDGTIVAYVDYAHNFVSTRTLIDFVSHKYAERNPRIIVVTGSVGDKAVDRREGIINGAQEKADRIILTSEDTVKEPMLDILNEMRGYITNPNVSSEIILDRAKAIEQAVREAEQTAAEGRMTVLLVIGKGEEQWIKVEGKHAPYEGDGHVVRRLLGIAQ